MAQAVAATADTRLAAAMSTYAVAPLTAQQLDEVAAAAAGVAQGFNRALPARQITAADMARLDAQGL